MKVMRYGLKTEAAHSPEMLVPLKDYMASHSRR